MLMYAKQNSEFIRTIHLKSRISMLNNYEKD